MNELFLELTKALEPSTQNSGKSSALTDTIRILRDLIAQVDSLKKENAVLLEESRYVAVEKNELKEENSAIEAQIKKLQSQIADRVHYPSSYLECNPIALQPELQSSIQAAAPGPVVGPVYVVPLQNDPKLYQEMVTKQHGTNVSKPHARYPSASDSWSFNILSEQQRAD
ncbi:hypothetical protein Ccrd_005250 [Cynara cardunculus var. scolymus]|uniref:Iron-related transcription factor 3 bHLH domain-containing protein n=2 Tax=Cynara cardunculus var. scolymus TaxID=59895 RepID=A0A124SC48_CYNCS|nr:hypothetical protein Ccrd_005250 [Cynara cardunculus var. scolymus]